MLPPEHLDLVRANAVKRQALDHRVLRQHQLGGPSLPVEGELRARRKQLTHRLAPHRHARQQPQQQPDPLSHARSRGARTAARQAYSPTRHVRVLCPGTNLR
jgi:hypothetical protein